MNEEKTLAQLQKEAKKAADAYELAMAKQQQAIMAKLAELQKQIEQLIAEADNLAASAGLRFVYSESYERFSVMTEDEWDSSSRYC